MFNWIKSFFSTPAVTNVVNEAEGFARTAADSALDAQVERQVAKLKKRVHQTNMAVSTKRDFNVLIEALMAAVKSAYGDRK